MLHSRSHRTEATWTEWQVRRLANEKAALERTFPDFSFHKPKSTSAYVEGTWRSETGRSYRIRVQLHQAYPDVVPPVYIIDPYPLVGFGGRTMDSYGTSHLMHTFDSDVPGVTKLCVVRPEVWDADWTLTRIVRMSLLWILAYEFHCDDGAPVDAFL